MRLSQISLGFLVSFGFMINVFAQNYGLRGPSYGKSSNESAQWTTAPNDSVLAQAVNSQKNVDYLEASGLKVIQLLPDDTNGLEHQKFVTRISNGKSVQVIYNLDMCERIPVKVGDVVSVGGQFVWTNQGGLVHWVHRDPKGHRKDGYVELSGKFYCR